MNKRERIRIRRREAAQSLCRHKFGSDYSAKDYNRAYDLLNRCIRYAIANDRFWETETEDNCNYPSRVHKEELLWQRFQRLNKELEAFDAILTGNMYPQVADLREKRKTTGTSIVCYLYSEYAEA